MSEQPKEYIITEAGMNTAIALLKAAGRYDDAIYVLGEIRPAPESAEKTMILYQLSMTAEMTGCDGKHQHVSKIVFSSREQAERELPLWVDRVKKTTAAEIFGIDESTIKTRIIELEVAPE